MQPDTDHRSQGRSNVFLSASLIVGGVTLAVRVRNMSHRGALLDGPSLPQPGAAVRLVRGTLSADGQIAWQRGNQAGLRFVREIDVAAWVKRVGHAGQQRVDDAIAALRRNEPAPANLDAAPMPSLALLSEELQMICDRLANSATLTAQFGEELVKLDTLAQRLRQMADCANG